MNASNGNRQGSVSAAERLARLRQSFGQAGIEPGDPMPVALVLADICDALALTVAERRDVLGWGWRRWLSEWGSEPVQLVDPQQLTTAAPDVNRECPATLTEAGHSEQG